MMIPWQIIVLAIANRMRDGWITEMTPSGSWVNNFFTQNGQMGRLLLWALPLAMTIICSAHFAMPWYNNFGYFIALWAFAFIGAACANWGTDDHPKFNLSTCAQLAWNGLVFTSSPAFITAATNWHAAIALALSGTMIVPAYVMGWAIKSTIPSFSTGTNLGSLFFGGFIGLFYFLGSII